MQALMQLLHGKILLQYMSLVAWPAQDIDVHDRHEAIAEQACNVVRICIRILHVSIYGSEDELQKMSSVKLLTDRHNIARRSRGWTPEA